jgi:hypothetical protein
MTEEIFWDEVHVLRKGKDDSLNSRAAAAK